MNDTQWLDKKAELNKRAYPELNGACIICGINPLVIKQNYYTKEQILELIGEDEHYGAIQEEWNQSDCREMDVRNQLRTELRTKLEKL